MLAVTTFKTEQEAMAIANDSPFGLGAAVISSCPQRCKRVAEAFESGIVWINCSQPCFVQAPWGGIKVCVVGAGACGCFGCCIHPPIMIATRVLLLCHLCHCGLWCAGQRLWS